MQLAGLLSRLASLQAHLRAARVNAFLKARSFAVRKASFLLSDDNAQTALCRRLLDQGGHLANESRAEGADRRCRREIIGFVETEQVVLVQDQPGRETEPATAAFDFADGNVDDLRIRTS